MIWHLHRVSRALAEYQFLESHFSKFPPPGCCTEHVTLQRPVCFASDPKPHLVKSETPPRNPTPSKNPRSIFCLNRFAKFASKSFHPRNWSRGFPHEEFVGRNLGRSLSEAKGGTLQIKCWDGCDEIDHFISFFDVSPRNVNPKSQTLNLKLGNLKPEP